MNASVRVPYPPDVRDAAEGHTAALRAYLDGVRYVACCAHVLEHVVRARGEPTVATWCIEHPRSALACPSCAGRHRARHHRGQGDGVATTMVTVDVPLRARDVAHFTRQVPGVTYAKGHRVAVVVMSYAGPDASA